MGETKNGMSKLKNGPRGMGRVWAEASMMGRIEYRGIGTGETKNGMSKLKIGPRGVGRVMGRGQDDGPNRGSMNWYGEDK